MSFHVCAGIEGEGGRDDGGDDSREHVRDGTADDNGESGGDDCREDVTDGTADDNGDSGVGAVGGAGGNRSMGTSISLKVCLRLPKTKGSTDSLRSPEEEAVEASSRDSALAMAISTIAAAS